jgi:hypothetical protein
VEISHRSHFQNPVAGRSTFNVTSNSILDRCRVCHRGCASALIHFGKDHTERWLLVRLKQSNTMGQASP